jgi:hypothetical protein
MAPIDVSALVPHGIAAIWNRGAGWSKDTGVNSGIAALAASGSFS